MTFDSADCAGTAAPLPFVDDARCNLIILWHQAGPQSTDYRAMVRRYRRVAARLGLAQEFEAMLQTVPGDADAEEDPP